MQKRSYFNYSTFNATFLDIEYGFPLYFHTNPSYISQNMISSASGDIQNIIASYPNNPLPVLGKDATLSLKAKWEQEIQNEALVHFQVTEPALRAMMETLMPYFIYPQ